MKIIETLFQRKEDVLKGLDKEYMARVTDSVFAMIMKTVQDQGMVVLTGSGTSGILAEKISFDLSCIKIPSFYLGANSAVHGGLGALRSNDLLIIVTRGCRTKETLDLLPVLLEMKIKFILVTENTSSDLAAHADIVIKMEPTKDVEAYGILSILFFHVVLAYFEVLYLQIMEHQAYKFEDFTHTHPGGAFGERVREHNQKKSGS
jgi:D-arabinose 5-phosphate isomerase GutQ